MLRYSWWIDFPPRLFSFLILLPNEKNCHTAVAGVPRDSLGSIASALYLRGGKLRTAELFLVTTTASTALSCSYPPQNSKFMSSYHYDSLKTWFVSTQTSSKKVWHQKVEIYETWVRSKSRVSISRDYLWVGLTGHLFRMCVIMLCLIAPCPSLVQQTLSSCGQCRVLK